jgi:hypothetical protein
MTASKQSQNGKQFHPASAYIVYIYIYIYVCVCVCVCVYVYIYTYTICIYIICLSPTAIACVKGLYPHCAAQLDSLE